MKFDVLVSNPPYHGTKGVGNTIYENHTLHYSEIGSEIVVVHPPGWRRPRPGTVKMRSLKELMWNKCSFLSICSDGFNAGTRYDYFTLDKNKCTELKISDEKGNSHLITKTDWNFIPNHSFDLIKKLLGDGAGVIRTSDYHSTSKNHISKNRDDSHIFPIVHSITSSDTKLLWSSKSDLGHFGISKVILSDAAPVGDVIIDMRGKYGMSEHCIGIVVESQDQAIKVKRALLTETFETIISATSWSNFQIDWRIFNGFHQNWYETVLEIEA